MNRAELLLASENIIKNILRRTLPEGIPVHLFGSRSRGDCRWNSDFDLWVDSDLPREDILAIEEQLEESIVPFRVDVLLSAPNLMRLPIHDLAFKEGVLL